MKIELNEKEYLQIYLVVKNLIDSWGMSPEKAVELLFEQHKYWPVLFRFSLSELEKSNENTKN